MSKARITLLVLLVVEGIGGVVSAVLTVIIGESITPGFIPWRSALTPALFGVACLAVALIYRQGHAAGRYLAAAIQVLVIFAASTGLTSSTEPGLWVALAMGVTGLVLTAVAAADQVGGATGG